MKHFWIGWTGWWMLGLAVAAEDPLKGPAFSDPSRPVAMDFEWVQRPIVYDAWATKEKAQVAISLDQQLHALLLDRIRDFGAKNHIQVALQEGTCGISGGMLVRKHVDMVGLCCPPGDTDRMPGLKFHTLGIASLAFIVHPTNPVENLSLAQLRRIFQGDVFNWQDLEPASGLAMPNLPIHVVGRLHCKLRPGHWRLLLDNGDLFSPRMQEVGTIPDMIYQVTALAGAIGYESLYHMERYQDKGLAKAVRINGMDPTDVEAVASLRYPLYRTFVVSTWEGALANPHAQKLLEFLLQEADNLHGKGGFVSHSHLRKAGWRFQENELVGEPPP